MWNAVDQHEAKDIAAQRGAWSKGVMKRNRAARDAKARGEGRAPALNGIHSVLYRKSPRTLFGSCVPIVEGR